MASQTLLHTPVDKTILIKSFEGGANISNKLRQYGIFVGDRVRVLRLAPFSGPVLVEVNGREIALGRGIAARIMVEADE